MQNPINIVRLFVSFNIKVPLSFTTLYWFTRPISPSYLLYHFNSSALSWNISSVIPSLYGLFVSWWLPCTEKFCFRTVQILIAILVVKPLLSFRHFCYLFLWWLLEDFLPSYHLRLADWIKATRGWIFGCVHQQSSEIKWLFCSIRFVLRRQRIRWKSSDMLARFLVNVSIIEVITIQIFNFFVNELAWLSSFNIIDLHMITDLWSISLLWFGSFYVISIHGIPQELSLR